MTFIFLLFLPCVSCVVSREVYSDFYQVATRMTAAALNLSNRAATITTLLASLDETLSSSVQGLVNDVDYISERADDANAYLGDLLETNLNDLNKDRDDAVQVLNQTLDAFQMSVITAEMSLQSLLTFVDTGSSLLEAYHGALSRCEISRKYCLVSWSGCEDVYRSTQSQRSGVYQIRLCSLCQPIPVYCDMETDGGGWTVIQRRTDTPESASVFNKSWVNYAKGFGSLVADFWLGNELIHLLTSLEDRTLFVQMTTRRGVQFNSHYKSFRLSSSKDSYRVRLCGFTGNGTDILSDGAPFIARDFHSVKESQVGWWADERFPTHNLNALRWKEQLKQTVIMVRSACFPVQCKSKEKKDLIERINNYFIPK